MESLRLKKLRKDLAKNITVKKIFENNDSYYYFVSESRTDSKDFYIEINPKTVPGIKGSIAAYTIMQAKKAICDNIFEDDLSWYT